MSDCCPPCLLKFACCAQRKARLTGQQDGGHLNGKEGVLSSLVHRCSPSLALSRHQDLERDPGLQTLGGGGGRCLLPSSTFLSTQSPPAVPSLVHPPVLYWGHQWLPSVKCYVIHSPWMLSCGFSLLRQSPLPALWKTAKIINATSARRGTGRGTRKIVFKMSPGFRCISGMGLATLKFKKRVGKVFSDLMNHCQLMRVKCGSAIK